MMGVFGTVLVDGGGTIPRPLRWLGAALRHPWLFVRSHSLRHWAERTVMLLVMQARDNSVRIRWNGRRLRTERGEGASTPTWIPEANAAARIAADVMGGLPGSGLNEVLLNRPFTAHILGGAPIGDAPDSGVIDAWHRVWAEPGLHVVDGAAVSANLGANPSLTIAAQAERALAFWPNRGEPDARPPARRALRADRTGAGAQAAARRRARSLSSRSHSLQTVRSSSYGMPPRCTTTWVLTARCRWGNFT